MSGTINLDISESVKIERYLDLLKDHKKLVLSSQGIIKKKKSPLARRISNGDVKAIIKAAKDRVYGSMSKKKRQELCKVLCELKSKLESKSIGTVTKEIIAWAIAGIVGLIDAASGLIISLLWIIREKLDSVICPCQLDRSCINGPCPSWD